MNLIKIINEEINNLLNGNIIIYHGTPFKKNADGILNNGLQQVGDFIVAGGAGSPSINGRSYVAKELWNAIRYSFYQPNTINLNWNDYIKSEPYGYVFEFSVNVNELLPDEDAIGEGVSEYLNKGNYDFYKKYLTNIDNNLLNKVKKGEFEAFAQIGKIIEPMLTNNDILKIVNNSRTATINKPILPQRAYKIKKPSVQFFKTPNDYTNYFNQNSEQIK